MSDPCQKCRDCCIDCRRWCRHNTAVAETEALREKLRQAEQDVEHWERLATDAVKGADQQRERAERAEAERDAAIKERDEWKRVAAVQSDKLQNELEITASLRKQLEQYRSNGCEYKPDIGCWCPSNDPRSDEQIAETGGPGHFKDCEVYKLIIEPLKAERDAARANLRTTHASDCSTQDPSCFYQAGCDCPAEALERRHSRLLKAAIRYRQFFSSFAPRYKMTRKERDEWKAKSLAHELAWNRVMIERDRAQELRASAEAQTQSLIHENAVLREKLAVWDDALRTAAAKLTTEKDD